MGDPIAEGISNFATNYLAARRMKQEEQLRQMQQEEIQRKLDEADREKGAAQNLADLSLLRSGVWAGKKPSTPTVSLDMPGGGLVNAPAGMVTEREPMPEDFKSKIIETKESLARKSPTLFFKQGEAERSEEMMGLRKQKTEQQIARLKEMRERAARLSPELAAAIQATMHDAFSGLLTPEEIEPKITTYMDMFGRLGGKKPPLGLGGRKKAQAPPEVLDALKSGAAKKVKKNGIIWQLDANGSPVVAE